MPADFELTIGANDKAWGSAMKRVERDGSRAARDVEQRWNRATQTSERAVDAFAGKAAGSFGEVGRAAGVAGTAIAAGLAVGIGAIKHYNDEFGLLDDDMREVKAAADELVTSLGRDLSLAIAGTGGEIASFVRGLNDIREGTASFLAFLATGGGSIEAEKELDRMERQKKLIDQTNTAREVSLELAQREARIRGDGLTAFDLGVDARVKSESEKISGLAAEGKISGSAAGDLIQDVRRLGEAEKAAERERLAEQKRAEQDRAAEAQKREEEKARREAEATTRERLALRETQSAERERFDRSLRMLELDELRAEGKDKEAELLKEQLRYEEDLKSIRESSLSDEEKFALLGEFRTAHSERVARIESGESEVVSRPGAGSLIGGSAQLQRQVFGGSTRSEQLLQQIASSTRDTAESNREMANSEGTPALAG